MLFKVANAHVLDVGNDTLHLTVNFDEVRNRHAREMLHLDALLLSSLLEVILWLGCLLDELVGLMSN